MVTYNSITLRFVQNFVDKPPCAEVQYGTRQKVRKRERELVLIGKRLRSL